MALSASFDFTLARSDLIPMALRKLGVLAEGQSASTNQTTTASLALNVMLKAWQSDGVPLWYIKTGYIYPVTGVNFMGLSASGGSHASEELILTALTAAAAASAGSITVSTTAADDVVGTTTNSDIVGIELDDGTVQWTTISAGGGTTSLTLGANLDSAAAVGNRVYAYTTKMHKPQGILDLYRVEASSGNRVQLDPLPRSTLQGYQLLTEGTPTSWSYIETVTAVPGTSQGNFMFWPRHANGDYYFEIRFQHPFDDMDADANNLSFPSAWLEAIVYGLALRLTDEYQVPDNVYKRIMNAASTTWLKAEEATTEGTSIYIQPARS
jgi:hypothetical protein